MNKHVLIVVGLFSCLFSHAQENRYVAEVFNTVTLTEDVMYGENLSILPIILQETTEPRLTELQMDVYEPSGDTLAQRPLVIVAHRGDFLPPIINQSPYGNRKDSAVVALCERFAKRGFVAAAISYRLGWNPFAEEILRKKGVLEAVYRITQDMRTCVRYFRREATESGNPFRIDTSRIAVGGYDAAAYAAYNVAYLKRHSQLELPKFVDFSQNPPVVFLDSALYGNPYGTEDRPLNVANHVGYSSEVNMVFGFQGGVGDISWIEAGDPPTIGVHNRIDFLQNGIRDVTISATGDIIIAEGARPDTIIDRSLELGNQTPFEQANLEDSLTLLALERSGGLEGLLVLKPELREGEVLCDSTAGAQPNSFGENLYPWNWYNELNFETLWNFVPGQTVPGEVQICRENLGNPNDPILSKTYVDTLASYVAPRMVAALDLITSSRTNLARTYHLKVYPNPATDQLVISSNEPILSVNMYNIMGNKVYESVGKPAHTIFLERQGLPRGVYFIQIQYKAGSASQSLIWE